MLFEGREPARIERGSVTAGAATVVDRLLRLKAELRKVLALSLFVVFVMIVVDFEFRMRVLLGRFLGRLQIFFWLLIVIIVALDFTGPETALRHPFAERLLIVLKPAGSRVDGHFWQVRDWLMRRVRICQHHSVLAIGWLEEEVDPVVLHEAADERQIGFAILNAVFDLVV